MRKITITALSFVLAISLSVVGSGSAFAVADIPDCSPCHGDEHKPGDDNPHGYALINENNEAQTEETADSPINSTTIDNTDETDEAASQLAPTTTTNINYYPIDENLTLETIEDAIEEEYSSRINALKSESEALLTELNSCETYIENVSKIDAFYQKIADEIDVLYILLKEYALKYTELILESDLSQNDKADKLDRMSKCFSQEAVYTISDEIINELLKNLSESIENNVLANNPTNISEKEITYETLDNTERYFKTKDFITIKCASLLGDIAIFYQNLLAATEGNDNERSQIKIEEFRNNLEKNKNSLGITDSISHQQTTTPLTTEATEDILETGTTLTDKNELLALIDRGDAVVAERNAGSSPFTEDTSELYTEVSTSVREMLENEETTNEDLQIAMALYSAALSNLKSYADYSYVEYSKMARNPEVYKDVKILEWGRVLQVMEGDDINILRVATDGEYDDVVLVGYRANLLDFRILEDDNVTIYGTGSGLYTYESTGGSSISVPSIAADYIVLGYEYNF